MAIILEYVILSNQHAICFKLRQCCMSIIFQKPGENLIIKRAIGVVNTYQSLLQLFFSYSFIKIQKKKIISKLKRHLPEDFQSLHFFFLIAAYLLGETQKSFFLRTETVSFIKKNPFAFQFEGKSLHMAVKSLRPCTWYGVWIRLKLDRNGQWNH